MITAVDSSVLIDVLEPGQGFSARSVNSLLSCGSEGALVSCEVVWAEVAAGFRGIDDVGPVFDRLGVAYSPVDRGSAILAGKTWGEYLRAGGSRSRLVADFLVGAHASRQADRLLTRDRGFYRSYFSDLRIIDPSG